MTDRWHKTELDETMLAFSSEFWQRHHSDIQSGLFWADRIKDYREEPNKRLRVAIENLPLPAAFKEATIATRSLIRQAKKQNSSYIDQLTLLYWLAAISSFTIPYSERLGLPGYNVMEATPGEVLKSLPFTYNQLGYEKLELLNSTDIKWLIELWGQPLSHSTLHELHHDTWLKYEDKLILEQKQHSKKIELNSTLYLHSSK